ncbi:glycosyl transferase [Paenibacillus sambharensis]|uniref:Glycosyl transferase n=1 Tax=Paenibacillus sambharensis TaxID=1803190 RepID=A0A2W1LQV4_9BACL|nr:glycosyltransferase [Paenibacillus sambharensis]PZD97225.1 glycosyl transferase [Paenibacillus sambharensis]
MGPLVTVVIPFYNCPFIGQALDSVLNQTYRNIEVIVIDDGSDRNQHLLAPYHGKFHYIGKANGGTASALNYGIRLASGKYVCWLSSDDCFLPDKIARQTAFMEASGARFSYTDYHVIDAHSRITRYNENARYPTYKSFVHSLKQFCPVNGCTVMMTKELAAGLGWFDESLPYTHDYDMWIRAALSGVQMHFIPEPLTLYRRHDQMGTVRHQGVIQQEIQIVQNRYRDLLEHRVALIHS